MLETPILYIVFNRPDVTSQSFSMLAQIKPTRLYIAADGPRASRETDAKLCDEVKQITENITWPCTVKRLYQPVNLGCGKAVSNAITWFFEQEAQGIIIEDDIIPNESFFAFATEMLNKYRDDQSIMHINGCNFQSGVPRSDGSYYFSAFPHVWGWASWRRAWKHYDFNLSDLNYFYNLKKINTYFKPKHIQNHWLEIFFKMNRKWLDTWDYQWNYAIWNNAGKVITPNVNLIRNIGFGEAATHTTDTNSKFANLETQALQSIIHPSSLLINERADIETYIYCN